LVDENNFRGGSPGMAILSPDRRHRALRKSSIAIITATVNDP